MNNAERINPIQLELRFALDEEFVQAVSMGNPNKVNELLSYRLTTFPDPECRVSQMPSSKLRHCKNRLVAFNSLCRYAARQGGVPPMALQLLSEQLLVKIEESTSVQYLHERLFGSIALEYTALVLNLSIKAYSASIRQAVVFINCHLSEPLTLSDISLVVHLNPSHLSRQFKRETGLSLNSYINKQRIALAKVFLETGKLSLSEIATEVGYANSDYFSKVFKREVGLTPTAYTKQAHHRKTCL